MPRKYRPPVARRRKNRTTNIPHQEQVPHDSGAVDVVEVESEDNSAAVNVAATAPTPADGGARESRDAPRERHVSRDYSYVPGEVVRIAAIGAFLLVALIITSIFR